MTHGVQAKESLEDIYDDLVAAAPKPTIPIKFGSLTAPMTAAMAAMNTLTSHLVYPYTGFEGMVSPAKELSQDLPLQHFLFGKSSESNAQQSPEVNAATTVCPQQ